MWCNALRARPKRRGKPKDDGERSVIADNILDRDFQADRPNQKWLADFTYIWTAEGWLYVAVVLDLFSRCAVGCLATRQGRRALHHSDQGSQGGFNRSSQHPDFGGADDDRQTAVGAIDAAQIVLARSAASLAA